MVSKNIRSRLQPSNCEICNFLLRMINCDQNSIQSAKPLKDFIANRLDESYKTDEMQDAEEFVNYLVGNCSILNRLTNFSVDITYKCQICDTLSTVITGKYLLIVEENPKTL